MTITGQDKIIYSFGGANLDIPITLTGTPAAIWLVVNTKDKGNTVAPTRNGYLGWHFVNKIDTTIFISDRYSRTPGASTITWNGKDENGQEVAAGTYTYGLWAYDDKTPRIQACQYVQIGFDWESQMTTIMEKGTDGKPLAKPILFGANPWYRHDADPASVNYGRLAHGTVHKWTLGGDPTDVTLLQTTRMGIFDDAVTDFTYGGPILNPTNYNIFYNCTRNFTQKVSTVMKWDFVAGGLAVQDVNWGNWDAVTLEDHGVAIGNWSQQPSMFTDGTFIYQVSPGLHQKTEEWNKLRVYSFEDGSVVMDKMMHEWYMPDDPSVPGYVNGSFHHMYARTTYKWFLLSHTSCMHEMIDTTRLVADADDETNMIMFFNSNGDYFMDSAYSPTVEPKWYCLADSKTDAMRRDSIAIDKNGFNVIGVSYLGLMSFGVSTQDGTGIVTTSFADDTVSDDKNLKGGGLLIDNGGAYDGLYYCSPLLSDGTGGWSGPTSAQTWFAANDSYKGIITDKVAVEKDAPSAFSVAQNSPNPFNPTTTINFTVPKSDRVTVEVYNIAGQKVDTLVNGTMSAGTHSAVWNASGKSAGVYFYTVKAGSFSKTMKMTLLK
jgi:flagellar hook assembly protein FlgD